MIVQLMECVWLMMNIEPVVIGHEVNRRPIIDSWATSSKAMSDVNFFDKLLTYDNSKMMTPAVYEKLRARFGEENKGWVYCNFRNQSEAASGLYQWVKCQLDIFALRM